MFWFLSTSRTRQAHTEHGVAGRFVRSPWLPAQFTSSVGTALRPTGGGCAARTAKAWWQAAHAWAGKTSGDEVRVGLCAQADEHDQNDDGQPARQLRQQPRSQQADQPQRRKVEPDHMDE